MAGVYRIEYETSDFSYKFHIAAKDMEEARDFLSKNMKKQFRINSMSEICRLDAITKLAFPDILVEQMGDKPTPIVENQRDWKCPWCGEVYKNEHGLKIHIGRSHK